jgi:hypothetical protein
LFSLSGFPGRRGGNKEKRLSYCEIILFNKIGNRYKHILFHNSWGGAAFIWDKMFKRYLFDGGVYCDNWLNYAETGGPLWTLHEKTSIPKSLRAIHTFCYDFAYVKRENFSQFVYDLGFFLYTFGRGDGACHLDTWAEIVKYTNASYVALYPTSVNQNPWEGVNLLRDKRVFEVYDVLREKHYDRK